MKQLLNITKKMLPIVLAVILLQVINVTDSQAAPPASGGTSYHRVRYGETLSSIGRRYGVNPYTIARVNGLYNPNHIYSGQVLHIPTSQRYNTYSNYNNRSYNNNYNRYNNNYNRYNNNYGNRYNKNYNQGNRYNNHYSGHSGYGGSWRR